MVATVSLHVWNSSPLADSGAIVGGIDLISADNADYDAANRASHPITVGQNSYEKWIRAHITVDPDNWIGHFKIWGDGGVDAGTTLRYGSTGMGVEPTASASVVAVTDFTTAVVGTKGSWDATVRDLADLAISPYSTFLVLQLQTSVAAAPGDFTTETMNYEYQEG